MGVSVGGGFVVVSSVAVAVRSWSGGRITGVAPELLGRRAVAGRGRVSEPAGVITTPGSGVVELGADDGGGGFAAAMRRSRSRLSGAWTSQMSSKNFMPKKVTAKKAKKAVLMRVRKAASTKMAAIKKPMNANPSPMDIIAIV